MTLFTIGPVEMFPEVLEAGKIQPPYFRTKEFSDIILNIEKRIKKMIGTNEASRLAILTSSGTGAMEASVMNVFNENDRLLIINGGNFGERFRKICELHKIPYDTLTLNPDEKLGANHFLPYRNKKYTGILVNIHETSTGQLYPIDIISNFASENNSLLVVDAIGSFLADPYAMDEYDVDVTIISSNKGLASGSGLAFVVVNTRAYKSILNNNVKSIYFNLTDYFVNIERGQTPYTPAISVLLQVEEHLKIVENMGWDAYMEGIEKRAEHFRASIDRTKYDIPNYNLSNMLTPIFPIKKNAIEIYQTLKHDNNLILNPSGPPHSNSMLRVGHIGNISDSSLNLLICLLNKI
ncbi:aspartate aminotransferase [Pelagirhabdus alkalitolerans]|uniref:Aspartate aminotransferase n=1 Tax=Pelagirhabdus alkalitolerans TaxID=1612202 RepID=A0A1G6L5V3_9BACI|nr:aminotransferase class V-fold PLP-dependent enzyme [Pelagirhabdus alkalitolerans]SDC38493.1 aspartate aminotransferase [Pelagirhabdus alkalitolerans]